MAQHSVLIAVVTVAAVIASSLCFHVDLPVEIALEQAGQARQGPADSILVAPQGLEAQPQQTTQAALPARIRDQVLSGIRDFGDNIRMAPNRLQECFQNITKCAQTVLRRNATATNAAGLSFPLSPLSPQE